ncbi:MAG: peptidase m75, imelysin [Cytophagales bacterium]|nr:MAG: peptidase m75, imelysin [Cytophagales bacterium]TAF62284.1 MAG: peptidase m75, imelysin [Cytophagales bacterium]
MKNVLFLGIIPMILFLASCENKDTAPSTQVAFVEQYSAIVYQNYSDAYTKALDLKVAIQALVSQPSEKTLQLARKAWLDSRPVYLQTEAFRMYAGPIDNDEGPEGRLNGWPLDESYVDYVQGAENAGIINRPDLFPNITQELLAELNEKDGETNLSAGYHVIEFLLWGQDLNLVPGTSGQRPYTDYVITTSGTGKHAARRAKYLQEAVELLLSDLDYLKKAWEPGKDNFRKSFAESPFIAIRKVLNGLKDFTGAELGGERMAVALGTKDQEDEHSCFSDNTNNDHLYDLIGIRNVYLGEYNTLSGSKIAGVGMSALVKAKKPELNTEIETLLTTIETQMRGFNMPFDEAILIPSEREKIQKTIDNLQLLSKKWLEAYDLVKE